MAEPIRNPLQKALDHIRQFRLWTDEEVEHSMQQNLANTDPDNVWVFGYGSLIWRPEFEFQECRLATLHGYHRALCLWSSVNRGTPERPGLVFGLDQGGKCEGKVFKLRPDALEQEFRALWKREMVSGAYIPTWTHCATEQGTVRALAFIMDRENHAYAKDLTFEETLQIILNATGQNGPCPEYVIETAHALSDANIQDHALFKLADTLKKTYPVKSAP
nr:gamma-glutamylcyclotransferase [Advenella sp. S44]